MRTLIVAAVVTLSAPAAAKPGAIAIPPMAIDVGTGTPLGDISDASTSSSTELHIGGSWASLYWKPTPVDFAIGYAGSYRTLGSDATIAREIDVSPRELRLHGMYVEVAYAIENHRHWRTWLGVRVETLTGEYQNRSLHVIGGALRLGSELYSTGVRGGGDSRVVGMFAGAFAIGVYVEGTARSLPKELGPVGVGAGVSVRIPFIAAIGS